MDLLLSRAENVRASEFDKTSVTSTHARDQRGGKLFLSELHVMVYNMYALYHQCERWEKIKTVSLSAKERGEADFTRTREGDR